MTGDPQRFPPYDEQVHSPQLVCVRAKLPAPRRYVRRKREHKKKGKAAMLSACSPGEQHLLFTIVFPASIRSAITISELHVHSDRKAKFAVLAGNRCLLNHVVLKLSSRRGFFCKCLRGISIFSSLSLLSQHVSVSNRLNTWAPVPLNHVIHSSPSRKQPNFSVNMGRKQFFLRGAQRSHWRTHSRRLQWPFATPSPLLTSQKLHEW